MTLATMHGNTHRPCVDEAIAQTIDEFGLPAIAHPGWHRLLERGLLPTFTRTGDEHINLFASSDTRMSEAGPFNAPPISDSYATVGTLGGSMLGPYLAWLY